MFLVAPPCAHFIECSDCFGQRYDSLVQLIKQDKESNLVTKTILIEELTSQLMGEDIVPSFSNVTWQVLLGLEDGNLGIPAECPHDISDFVAHTGKMVEEEMFFLPRKTILGIMERGYDVFLALGADLKAESLNESAKVVIFNGVSHHLQDIEYQILIFLGDFHTHNLSL